MAGGTLLRSLCNTAPPNLQQTTRMPLNHGSSIGPRYLRDLSSIPVTIAMPGAFHPRSLSHRRPNIQNGTRRLVTYIRSKRTPTATPLAQEITYTMEFGRAGNRNDPRLLSEQPHECDLRGCCTIPVGNPGKNPCTYYLSKSMVSYQTLRS